MTQARIAGVAGWVRNLPDGSVEAHLQGASEAVDQVLDWMRSGGPPAGRVDQLHVEDTPPVASDGFDVR